MFLTIDSVSRVVCACGLALLVGLPVSVCAAEAADPAALRRDLDALQQRMDALGRTQPAGGGALRLADTSVDVLLAGGGSTEDGAGIAALQGGGHDPKRNGFTLQQAEVSFAGAVDPFFTGEAHLVLLEDEIELEEAYATSTSLPGGMQVKAGYFLTEFGRLNPTHPHTWAWLDQPVIASRLLGEDGLRAAGVRVGWLMPTAWYSQLLLGVQNADDGTAVSFLGEGHSHDEGEAGEGGADSGSAHEETVGGRPVLDRPVDGLDDLLYSVRWENAADVGEDVTALVGLSALRGPNATGAGAETLIYGADLTVKWRPATARRGYPFLAWQTEFMRRDFDADAVPAVEEAGGMRLASATIEDWGLYSQLLWGFAPGWEAGLRAEYATGNREGAEARAGDPSRCDRTRISPLLAFRPSEFSRIRLQYDYDDADFLPDGDAHTVWAGLEFLFGMHPAHKY